MCFAVQIAVRMFIAVLKRLQNNSCCFIPLHRSHNFQKQKGHGHHFPRQGNLNTMKTRSHSICIIWHGIQSSLFVWASKTYPNFQLLMMYFHLLARVLTTTGTSKDDMGYHLRTDLGANKKLLTILFSLDSSSKQIWFPKTYIIEPGP